MILFCFSIVFVVIYYLVAGFISWLGSGDKNKKHENQEKTIMYAVNMIEEAHKISAVYPPGFLKGRITNCIVFGNSANEIVVANPKCTICVICNGRVPIGEDFSKLLQDSNRNRYYSSWIFSDSDHGIYNEWQTQDIGWIQLKKGVYSTLKERHPEWEVADLDTNLSIWV